MKRGRKKEKEMDQPSTGHFNVTGITKLNDSNYRTWKGTVKLIFTMKKISEALEGQVSEDIDVQARLILFSMMDENHKSQIMICQTD